MADATLTPEPVAATPATKLLTNKYETAYREHLTKALKAAGLDTYGLIATSSPNISRPAPIRQYDFTMYLNGKPLRGSVTEAQPHRLKNVLKDTLARMRPHVTRWQYFRFWVYLTFTEFEL